MLASTHYTPTYEAQRVQIKIFPFTDIVLANKWLRTLPPDKINSIQYGEQIIITYWADILFYKGVQQ
jgi:hypothetical protein